MSSTDLATSSAAPPPAAPPPSVPRVPTRRGGRAAVRHEDVAGLGRLRAGAFVGPAFLLIGLFLVFPAVWTLWLGLTDYRLTGIQAAEPSFVGIENYVDALGDEKFRAALGRTLVFVGLSGVIGQSCLGFSIAWMLRSLPGPVKMIVEGLVLAAWVIPSSVGTFLWIALLDRRDGTLNALASVIGREPTAWLIEHPMACIVVFNIWVGTAFSMLLFTSALSAVPPSQLESARMVGAGGWQQLRDVVLPNIRGHILTNTLLITLWTFNTFTPYMLTKGGPNGATEILPVYIYNEAIGSGQLGRGAAISLIMLAINLVIATLYLRLLGRRSR